MSRIRLIRPDDLPAINAIHAVSFDDLPAAAAPSDLLARPHSGGLVAIEDAELVGYAIGQIVWEDCQLLSFAVEPSYRGFGIGRDLLLAMLAYAVAERAQAVTLEVSPKSVEARSLYSRNGFKIEDVRGYHIQTGMMDVLVMRRDLADVRGALSQCGRAVH